ncbi:MAG: M23 family metallopeptidase, partial [Myxococcales bacterium]|nr:M23 family metallopeptidase [Myxococcales bacterium]
RWMPKLRRCARRAGRRFCDGPRMVPVAAPEDAARAARLELGTRRTASRLLIGAPDPEWVLEAGPATLDLAWPVDAGQVSRGYGFVRRQALRHRRHDGIDFSAARGTAVRAANHGLVAYADNGVSGFGNLVIIVHGDGSTTLYAHLQEAHVTAGQLVEREQTIGRVGNTGLSRGPHLHFEWRKGGRPIDPARALHRPGDEHDHAPS